MKFTTNPPLMSTSNMVIITNRSGNEYEVTKERAEKMVKNGDIEYTDIRPIGTPKPLVETVLDEIASIGEEIGGIVDEVAGVAETIVDAILPTTPEMPTVPEGEVAGVPENTPAPAVVTPTATIIDGVDEIKVLRAEYKQKFGKGVPVAKINNAEWIKEQIAATISNA